MHCEFIHRPRVLHTDAGAVSRIYSHTPITARRSVPTKEIPFTIKKLTLNSNKELDFLKPFWKINPVQKMGKQLPLLERIPQTTDPWEDINLFKYIKSGYHVKILSARKMRRIEFLAKRYVFSENTLFYRCKFEIGDEPILKPIPTKESREELVKRTHNLGHFSFEKTYGLIKEKYYWPLMSRKICN